ncbi:MAG: hypothetical protein M9927_12790 [Anaerolineae bacterium]|nr:hypothetical protein [Anaerolineae bacterium]
MSGASAFAAAVFQPLTSSPALRLPFASCLVLLALALSGCGSQQPIPTPTPTKTPAPLLAAVEPSATATATAAPSDTPTATASPTTAQTSTPTATEPLATNTPLPPATAVPEAPTATPQPAPAAVVTPLPTATSPLPAATLPPQRGGTWDMEEGFYPWPSPYEGFTAFVGNGWQPFEKVYEASGPPRLNENKHGPNIHSGNRSQEISFDWRSGETGLYRVAETIPGHLFTVEAWAKYVPSESGLQLYLGIDPTGGEGFEAPSVVWFPWRDMTPDQWISTQESVRAQGDRTTIFLRAVHPLGAGGGHKPGGNTMFDDVSLVDLGP